jgi:diamine N-acetyltransferase
LKEYAFSFLGLKQLYAYIPDDNIASQALFSRCGYKKTATLQDWLKTPAGWQSVYVFQLLV